MYQRSIGSIDPACVDPNYAAIYPDQCSGGGSTPSGSGFDLNNLINTVLNDITQIVKPGSPSIHPLYTPTSTALGASNLLPLAAIGVVAYLLLSRKH